jgi:hypothetical protein
VEDELSPGGGGVDYLRDALKATPFRVFSICRLPENIEPILGYKRFCLSWTQNSFKSVQRWRDAGCADETFEAHHQR